MGLEHWSHLEPYRRFKNKELPTTVVKLLCIYETLGHPAGLPQLGFGPSDTNRGTVVDEKDGGNQLPSFDNMRVATPP